MDYSQSCSSICSLLGALKNTTPSSGDMSLFDKSSAQTKENWEKPHNYTKSWPFSLFIMCNYNYVQLCDILGFMSSHL